MSPPHLAVLVRVPAAQLVDSVEVVRGDDEAAELTQVAALCVRQAGHAVVVHCGLTPHTPARDTSQRRHQRATPAEVNVKMYRFENHSRMHSMHTLQQDNEGFFCIIIIIITTPMTCESATIISCRVIYLTRD